jgi:steroid 5-alpha reductase family enzyme
MELPTLFWQILGGSAAIVFLTMSIAAIFAAKWKNAGIVDVIWGSSFAILAIAYALLGPGDTLHCLLIAGMVAIANGRLAVHLLQRFRHEFPEEDRRYGETRKAWDEKKLPTDWLFYGIFLIQGIMVVLLSAPFLLVCFNPATQLDALDWTALGLWTVAFIGEAIADAQLKAFKAKAENKGKICQDGLWAYSRHPNYFFEWLLWCAYFLFALSAPGGIWTIYAPLLMLFFLIKVSGVELSEKQSLKSRGDAYRDYQKRTSAFIPWFKLNKA